MKRRDFIRAGVSGVLVGRGPAAAETPNIILIYADDLGYGDLSCYGSCIRTPHIDRLAHEGVRLTHFYSASPVCSPSRAALMTGRYPARVGVPRVLFPDDTFGLPLQEMTLADSLKTVGYRTSCIGKWHLGSIPPYLPTNRGFDEYFGLPYSNDLAPSVLMRDTTVIEEPVELDTLTERYTNEAIDFIQRSAGAPFFLYFAHTFPHIPLAASSRFQHKSGFGPYGDTIREIDWSVGELLKALSSRNLERQTIVMFSSDNGPWFQGSPGRLRGRKGETWDGGMRMPFLVRYPGHIPARRVLRGVASTMDVFPTLTQLARAKSPAVPLDGVDIWPMLTGQQEDVPHDVFLFMDGWNVQCGRFGGWKLHVSRNSSPAWAPLPNSGVQNLPLMHPELYYVETDGNESYDCSEDFPDIVKMIRARMEALILTFPQPVQDAWRDTLQRHVGGTPSGALPAALP